MIAYFDMFSGVSGDMILGSLLDAGLSATELRASLAGLAIGPFDLEVERVRRGPLAATLATWRYDDADGHRHLADIERVIGGSGLPGAVKQRSLAVFRRLAEAEARVHGVPVAEVHFHEVGAVDAILDVCGSVSALALLGVERVEASPFRTGRGFIEVEHGTLPLPAPAVPFLVEGWRLEQLEGSGELTTPTGAAIVATLARPPGGAAPALVVRGTGYGAGTRDPAAGPPNCLRVLLGDAVVDGPPNVDEGGRNTAGAVTLERLLLVETNIDDMNPQIYGWLEERLFGAGAREVFFTAVTMKKGRPGTLVRCLADEQVATRLADVLFRETSTLGVRQWPVERRVLPRSEETALTSFGPVRVKRVRGLDGRDEVRPEYEACRRLAEERGLPLRDVLARLTAELDTEGLAASPPDAAAVAPSPRKD